MQEIIDATPDWFDETVRSLPSDAGVQSKKVRITPAFAQWLLDNRNTRNRNFLQRYRQEWVRKMKDGQFVETGQTICVATDGMLNDGQHRLFGVSKQPDAFVFIMCFNESVKAFFAHGTGKKRSMGVILNAAGYAHGHALAATARICYVFERGEFGRIEPVDEIDLRRYIDENDGIEDGINACQRMSDRVAHTNSAVSALFFLLRKHTKRHDRVNEFIELAINGNAADANNAVLVYRNGFAKRVWENNARNSQSGSAATVAAGVNAWNYWLKNKPAKVLSLRSKEDVFPKIT